MYTLYRQSYELVIKVWLNIYVFPWLLNFGKYVTVSLLIIPLNFTNNFLMICMIIISHIKIFMKLAMLKRLMIKTVTVIDDSNVNLIYKSYNNCTQKTLFWCYNVLAVIMLLTVLAMVLVIIALHQSYVNIDNYRSNTFTNKSK